MSNNTVQESVKNQPAREGRRFSMGVRRGKARSKLRYVESNAPKKGCRFL